MQANLSPSVSGAFLGRQVEEAVDELNLTNKIPSCYPSNLPLPDHVDCFVALNRSPSCLDFSEALLGVHATFDGSMILFKNVVQVLHGSVSTALAQRPFLLTIGDRGAVYRRQVGVDHSRLRMGSIAERLAKTGAWPRRRHGTLTARNRWWHPWNRWPDTGSTSDPSHERRFRPLARTCLSA